MDTAPPRYGPWTPGIQSQIPAELRQYCTIFRPDNVFTGITNATDLQLLTGLPLNELVAFRPERLLLHELLIRVTADFYVPDGSRIEDLGINFREITTRLLTRHLEPEMAAITAGYEQMRLRMLDFVQKALFEGIAPAAAPPAVRSRISRFFRRGAGGREPRPPAARQWGPEQIASFESSASTVQDPLWSAAYRSLARVMSALFRTHGRPWGTPEMIAALATDLACNIHGSAEIGRTIGPLLERAAPAEGFSLLPRQDRPIVINTKGPSASGKSSLRPLQKLLAQRIGASWREFAVISPDIWRKQLLDYGSLGTAYKYAGAFTSEELQIIDEKLDRYMALKHRRGDTGHLLIDRFRFDSFAPDSDEPGSNLLTRFGDAVHLFFVITPPEMLVERAWKRGLEVGRYKAVDDTLAHSVEAYAGMPDVFFTWVGRGDKRLQFEFLDNSVRLGQSPRTVAFGTNSILNVLDVKGILDIVRYGRVNIAATSPELLYADRKLLAAEFNLAFLRRCVERFREINFAQQRSGRIYLRMAAGRPLLVDCEALQEVLADPSTRAGISAVAPGALDGTLPSVDRPIYLWDDDRIAPVSTLGEWGPDRS